MDNKEMPHDLRKVAEEFLNSQKIVEIKEIESGHINKTYLVVMPECIISYKRLIPMFLIVHLE